MHRVLPILLLLAGLTGCVRREGLNTSCQWPNEAPSPLDVHDPAHWRHLVADARFAEELAIRHGDSFRGRETVEERGRRVDQCTARLFTWIVRLHDVSLDDVQRAREYREVRVDLVTVFAPMALLFGVVATFAAARVRRRFPADERWPALVATLLVSAVASGALVLVGELWSWMVEMVRIGDSHLSYRAFRLPWGRHRLALFTIGVALFWMIAWLGSRTASRNGPPPEP
jgi:hypothetical protein